MPAVRRYAFLDRPPLRRIRARMDQKSNLRSLVAILRLAYSGELAAAFAYRGHWKSVRDPADRDRIREIEAEELHHRHLVGVMLRELGFAPSVWLEIKACVIGKTLGALCHVAGWFAPMYGAGKLESRNIAEYVLAARHAREGGHEALVDCLLRMAEVEWEHERFFRNHVLHHHLSRRFPPWPEPPPKASIREGFPPASVPQPTSAARCAPVATP
jgi:hypothetical protein